MKLQTLVHIFKILMDFTDLHCVHKKP